MADIFQNGGDAVSNYSIFIIMIENIPVDPISITDVLVHDDSINGSLWVHGISCDFDSKHFSPFTDTQIGNHSVQHSSHDSLQPSRGAGSIQSYLRYWTDPGAR